MNIIRMTIIGAVAAVGLSAALPAFARDSVNFSFDVGNVRMGYSDGYWDNGHNWHRWHNSREAREFRGQYHDRYAEGRHNRYRNAGWRDSDGDGVPNRADSHPNNPYRN